MNILDQVLSRSDDWKEHFICLTSSRISYVKTDEEKVKIALQYLTSAETKLNIQKQIKSTTKAREYIKEGEQKLETSSWPDSVEIFTKVVMHAEINSNELAQAYANRSAALYIGGLYENALTDIERALKIGYSDNEKTKLYVRRAKCLFALKNTMSPEIEEALADAHKWLGKMNDADKERMKDILNEFPKNSSAIEVPYHKYDYNQLLPKPPQDNPKIPGVSDAVELKYSKEFGRHVVATKNIKAGETIMVRRAYATVINARFRHKYCWYCCKQLWTGIACHKCVDVIYCDENCRNKAWQEYHDIECSVISAISSEELNSLDSLTLRLTVKAYKEAGTLEKLQEKINKIDKIDDPLIKCLTDNVFDSANYASVYSLSRQTEDLFMNTVRASVILYSLAATTNIFGEKINDFGELSKNKYAAFIGGLIKTNFEISLMNSTKLTLDGDTGLIVDSFWSMLNHSCDPTVINFASGDISALIAFQRIQEGEQIFLSYGPEFIYDKRDKRREDLKKFEFNCECTACIQNWGPYSHLFFPSHRLTCLSMDLKQKLKFAPTVDKFSNDFDTIFGNLDDELEIISAALDLLDFYQCNHGYPTREIMELKKFVREGIRSVRPEY
ncbi:hypothetical protein PV328_006415 [Microctonus aethiopoides]|uniref:SET and MYND domain-containing protein 4 n=1 Tax=Microctonus aethiopoides TaxID=144406 RepID=A0AA39FP23_9HYME|nr:hypothetical protein PV328_006415 [Microctonus aethiopoides]